MLGPTPTGCLLPFPVWSLDQPPVDGSSAVCPADTQRSGLLETMRAVARDKVRETVVPYLQGDLESCENPEP